MIEMILDKYILFVLMGSIAVLGIICKFVVSVTLKRLVHAAGNMNKSNHPLMRLVRAKFEHTCMISEKVENVRVFVDKYLYEYRVAGMKLHSWRRMELAAAGMCLLIGMAGGVLEYSVYGMQDMVLKTGAVGAGLAILVFLVHLTTDEGYRLEAVRNYMVDYLENICLHRYEKAYQKELKVMSPEAPVPDFSGVADQEPDEAPRRTSGREQLRVQERGADTGLSGECDILDVGMDIDTGRGIDRNADKGIDTDRRRTLERGADRSRDKNAEPEITPPVMPEPYDVPKPYDVPDAVHPVRSAEAGESAAESLSRAMEAVRTERKPQEREARREAAKEPTKDLLIRQILEEFMA